jgi:hypothetical protein
LIRFPYRIYERYGNGVRSCIEESSSSELRSWQCPVALLTLNLNLELHELHENKTGNASYTSFFETKKMNVRNFRRGELITFLKEDSPG